MFLGAFEHRIDTKGRLVLPARFRQELGDDVVVSMGLGTYLSIHTPAAWEDLLRRLRSASFPKGRAEDFIRVLLATAAEAQFDAAGRILLPQLLRDRVGLVQDVVVAGQRDHVEIWEASNWASYQERILGDFTAIAGDIEGW